MIVHLIKNNDPKIKTLRYKSQIWLEKSLRGYSVDLILLHGIKAREVDETLMKTLKMCVKLKNGIIIFMSNHMGFLR